MPGETWRGFAQIGKEVTAGSGVAATRRIYLSDLTVSKDRPPRPRRYATGTRDNQRAIKRGSLVAGGSASLGVSADEILEWLLIGVKGGVTPTTPGGATNARLWTFVPGDLDSATVEVHDGARIRRLLGARANSITIAGSVAEENLLTAELFATDLADLGSMTGSLAQRTPAEFDGWETATAIDPFGDAPGTTPTEHVINWSLTFNNNLGRKYVARNSQAAFAVNSGEMDITASLLMEASETETQTELDAWDGGDLRTVQLIFGDNEEIESGFNTFVKVSIAGAWVAADLGQTDAGTRAYQLNLDYVYEPTELAAGVKFEVQNARTAAY